ncbi:MAG: S-methyl-5-thioribose-1-phosphate isomerase [SAR202 cluster bacterium]|nr:S-methyl-5-thioribose-1-phosphate isomerase [SAR202 cluster bacterium]
MKQQTTAIEAPAFRCIEWADGTVRLIDQTRLPAEEVWLELSRYQDVIAAIKEMRIRGAPAIGVAGAYALALAAQSLISKPDFAALLKAAAAEIADARPTGANLSWAVRRMMAVATSAGSPEDTLKKLTAEAIAIQREDEDANHRMGRFGADLLPHHSSVLTHCNTGALATGGYGTAFGIIHTAWKQGRLEHVYATETRPLLQGARLTAWELARAGITATLLPDSAAGTLMRQGRVQAVITGADRIAANGDTANKIGTYSLAVLAAEHDIPFYIAAPTSTIDMRLPTGGQIAIEERHPDEVTHVAGKRTAAEGVSVFNPAFDVAPGDLIAAIVTERGVARAPYQQSLKKMMERVHG